MKLVKVGFCVELLSIYVEVTRLTPWKVYTLQVLLGRKLGGVIEFSFTFQVNEYGYIIKLYYYYYYYFY